MKEKKEKIKKTPKQRFQKFLKVIGVIALIFVLIGAVVAVLNVVSDRSLKKFIETIPAVTYDEQLTPVLAQDGYYTFTTDGDFKVMQLTDVHLGGGILSVKKDSLAINAVAAMIAAEKPDLVVVTGDIAYPIPFSSLTFNNKTGAVQFAQLMEKLGVYWALAFGNHDTEIYSYYTREQISRIYTGGDYPHCLLQTDPDEVDGASNYIINVKNTKGEIFQSLVLLDSHSYVDNDYFGVLWKYDTIHENQVQWYEKSLKDICEENNGVMPKSLAFFHIPLPEFRTAWETYVANGFQDSDDVKYVYGIAGETNGGVYCSEHNYGFYDKVKELDSTKAIFCGHDHLNNFSLDYKGVKLNYGYSVDYLAYPGIMKYGLQRGCTMIDVRPDGSFEYHLENYYQDKYQPTKAKESVLMEDMRENIPLKSAPLE